MAYKANRSVTRHFSYVELIEELRSQRDVVDSMSNQHWHTDQGRQKAADYLKDLENEVKERAELTAIEISGMSLLVRAAVHLMIKKTMTIDDYCDLGAIVMDIEEMLDARVKDPRQS